MMDGMDQQGLRIGGATWAEIRRRWMETAEPVRTIATSIGIAQSTIHRRARKEQWPPRPLLVRRIVQLDRKPWAEQAGDRTVAGADHATTALNEPARRTPDSVAGRVARLFRLIDMQIDAMERTMTTGEPASAQDQERHARAMTGVLANMDKVAELAATVASGTKPEDGEGTDAHADAEAKRMRREIAERLERLNAQWLPREPPR
ncbi:MAG: hypothetical protein NW216_09570 [Hyphomicrobium sp.]|nr:hypothetical protein [Hyphomicrobium sp.]